MISFNSIRKAIGQKLDQLIAVPAKWLFPNDRVEFDNEAKFALITVNFSTTYYLKLMLLTLCEQNELDKINRIIVVDNQSRDGGLDFLKELTQSIERIELVENKIIKTHAKGLRVGIKHLDKVEKNQTNKSNVLMVCDTDIIFRDQNTIKKLSKIFQTSDTAFAGELRYSDRVCPQAQASFLCLRRDIYARKDIMPFVNHGSPAYWLQKSLWKASLKLNDFPSNFGGYILHRGRSGVAAAKSHYPNSSFAKTNNNQPHYMGVENGEKIWKDTEKRYKVLLQKASEKELLQFLIQKLN